MLQFNIVKIAKGLTKNYFRNLRGINDRYSLVPNNTEIDLANSDLSKLTSFNVYSNANVLSFDALKNSDKLTYFVAQGTYVRQVQSLEPLDNKKIYISNTSNMYNLIHDSLYQERVKLHMDFNSNNILTQDSTRHANKLNNHGAIVTDT